MYLCIIRACNVRKNIILICVYDKFNESVPSVRDKAIWQVAHSSSTDRKAIPRIVKELLSAIFGSGR